MSIPATSFPRFNHLPKELRLNIWKHALPGPRIIHVERHIADAEEEKKREAAEDWSQRPLATYFSSPSPCDSIISLSVTCGESRKVVHQHYSLAFPASSTWVDFTIDFIYLDWGSRYFRTVYHPEHFMTSWEQDYLADRYEHPRIDADIRKQVKNLAVFESPGIDRAGFRVAREEWVVRDILRIFPAVDVLVFADQLHSRDEVDKELVWLSGEIGEQLDEKSEGWSGNESIGEKRLRLRQSMLWGDYSEYGACYPFNLSLIRSYWENHLAYRKEKRKMPKIASKSITSAALKKELLEICGSEENVREFDSMEWAFINRGDTYSGRLNLSQRIAFLKLALSRISTDEAVDCQGMEVRGIMTGDIPCLLARIDALEEMMRDSVVREVEEMKWDYPSQ